MNVPHDVALLLYTDPVGDHSFTLQGDVTSIGRSADQDLVLQEPFVSRRHAVIQRGGGSYEVIDQGSTHGTYLNGSKTERAVLHNGDTLQFGSPHAIKIVLRGGRPNPQRNAFSPPNDLLTALSALTLIPNGEVRPAAEMEKLNFLLNAARQLNAGGAIKDILRALLQLSIQLTKVERGFVFLREDGEMRMALGLGADGRIVEEDSTVSRRAMQQAIESEAKFSISDTLAGDQAASWESVLINAIRSIYCLPLRGHVTPEEPNRLLGLLYLDSKLEAGKLSEIDHQVLDTVATEAATLLHNALLAEAEQKAQVAAQQLAVAAKIHASLMAITLPTLPYAVLQARSMPSLQIGGDFYDVVVLHDSVCVAIADVSGKGVPASIVAATLQGILHAQAMTGQGLAEIATLVNRFLCSRNVGKYATMVLLKLFPDGFVEYVNCGHVPPVVVSEEAVRQLEESNLVVGLIPDALYAAAQFKLKPGERILLATDGITEAENSSGEEFGDSGLQAIAQMTDLDAMMEHLATFQATAETQDDWTLVDVRYTGSAS